MTGCATCAANAIAGWQNLQYFVVPGAGGATPSPRVLDLGSNQSTFNLLWGSIDVENSIEFFTDAALLSSVGLVSGQDVFDAGGQPSAQGAAAVKIDAGAGEFFRYVVFRADFNQVGTDRIAFEFSSLNQIPLPAAGFLLLGGLAGLGLMSRRRKAAA